MIAKREGNTGLPRGARRRAATTSTGSSATSTGTCSTRSTCSATSTPTCTRPTCSSCPGDAIGYVDFGIVGQLPDRVRDSLTRYSWLLFRGEVESAVLELMRWLAPGPRRTSRPPRWQLDPRPPGVPVRHRRRPAADDGGRPRAPLATPRTRIRSWRSTSSTRIRVQRADDVGRASSATSRCWSRSARSATQLAVDYDLQENVQRFVRRLARQQGIALLDPRRTFDRLYAGTGRDPARARSSWSSSRRRSRSSPEATTMLFGYRNRIRRVKARSIGFGAAVLVVGGAAVPGPRLP